MRPNRILVAVSRVAAETPVRSRVAAETREETPVRSRAVVAIPDRSRAVVETRVAIPVRSRVAVAILDRSLVADGSSNRLTFSEPDEIVRLFFSVTLH